MRLDVINRARKSINVCYPCKRYSRTLGCPGNRAMISYGRWQKILWRPPGLHLRMKKRRPVCRNPAVSQLTNMEASCSSSAATCDSLVNYEKIRNRAVVTTPSQNIVFVPNIRPLLKVKSTSDHQADTTEMDSCRFETSAHYSSRRPLGSHRDQRLQSRNIVIPTSLRYRCHHCLSKSEYGFFAVDRVGGREIKKLSICYFRTKDKAQRNPICSALLILKFILNIWLCVGIWFQNNFVADELSIWSRKFVSLGICAEQ